MEQTIRSVKCDQCEKELVVDDKYPHNYGLNGEQRHLKCLVGIRPIAGSNPVGDTY